jgi:hypothetical protein
MRIWRRVPALVLSAAMLFVLGGARGQAAGERPPNILFIIMDDVGIDQMQVFGYGGKTPPRMPTIKQVAESGVRFRNTWSMPACTTSRAVFFSGRFPLRTNIQGALGPSDLANSHLSPFEVTTPKLLKQRGYRSAMFGKFHLALQDNSPFGLSMVKSLGWDYFYGWLDKTGDPSSIDKTAGGVDPSGKLTCGFVPGAADGGADSGACYRPNNTCRAMSSTGPIPPGRACRDAGGIFDPGEACQSSAPDNIKEGFKNFSGHYVSPLVINHEDGTVEDVPTTDLRARGFRGSTVVDAAIDWIGKQSDETPWMASVNFASVHTPLMQPPPSLLPPLSLPTNDFNCLDGAEQLVLSNQMIEAMDTEIGRLLVKIGVAQRDADGGLRYDPANSNTMIVIVGDNGSFAATVKQPFDGGRSKGTAYQTGVWVPLMVAGPLVAQPNREVPHMVNIADLYQLFGEVAGIDVSKSVPQPVDGVSMLPYLTNPKQPGIRRTNFTQVGPNIQANGATNGPCLIRNPIANSVSCTQIPVTKEVCEDNGGAWWGAGADADKTHDDIPAEGFKSCCEVKQFLLANGEEAISIQPMSSIGLRNGKYKIVKNFFDDLDAAKNTCGAVQTDEFYEIDQAQDPKLDTEEAELKAKGLTREQRVNYDALSRELNRTLNSQPECTGDGNVDGVVDGDDIAEWEYFAVLSQGKSSWYDLDRNGLTDAADLQIIRDNLGTRCKYRK